MDHGARLHQLQSIPVAITIMIPVRLVMIRFNRHGIDTSDQEREGITSRVGALYKVRERYYDSRLFFSLLVDGFCNQVLDCQS